MRKPFTFLAIAPMAANTMVGCAARTQTVKQETVQYSDRQWPSDSELQNSPQVVETETTETTETHESHRGVLGATVDFAGSVIALPFRLVGGAIDAIF